MKDLYLIGAELLALFTRTEHDGHFVRTSSNVLQEPDKFGLRLMVPNNIDYQDLLHIMDAKTRYGFEQVEIHAPSSLEEDGNVVILFFDDPNADDNPF